MVNEESWPANARAVRTAFLDSEEGKARPDATPRFILAKDEEVILAVTGNAGWKDKMWPRVLDATGSTA